MFGGGGEVFMGNVGWVYRGGDEGNSLGIGKDLGKLNPFGKKRILAGFQEKGGLHRGICQPGRGGSNRLSWLEGEARAISRDMEVPSGRKKGLNLEKRFGRLAKGKGGPIWEEGRGGFHAMSEHAAKGQSFQITGGGCSGGKRGTHE